jgi:hypothetical protein
MENMAVCELAGVNFPFPLRHTCRELDEGLRVNGKVRAIIKDYPLVLRLSKYGFSLLTSL